MNTSDSKKIESKYVSNVRESSYEFNRFDKDGLFGCVSVLELKVNAEAYSDWGDAAESIVELVFDKFCKADMFCFITTPYWKKLSRTARYYGLGKFLKKEHGLDLDFLIEKPLERDREILFCGVVRLTPINAGEIFDLISDNENGIVFACEADAYQAFHEITDGLAEITLQENRSSTFMLNVVEAVNVILNKGGSALFPHAWKETGEYRLDIFTKAP